jgi:DNA repair protein RecO (recombination protein O)
MQDRFTLDLAKGGVVCGKCRPGSQGRLSISKGTIKRLLWVEDGGMIKAARIRFTADSLKEGVEFLEAFVPYHLGKQPRSLKFLRQIRMEGS